MLHYPGADSDGIIRVGSLSLNEIGQFIKDCVKKHNAYTKWYSVRVNVKSTDPPLTGGYFDTSSYSIMWCVSSINYGWAIIMSDMNDEKVITFGRLAGGNWHWLKPTLTLIN